MLEQIIGRHLEVAYYDTRRGPMATDGRLPKVGESGLQLEDSSVCDDPWQNIVFEDVIEIICAGAIIYPEP